MKKLLSVLLLLMLFTLCFTLASCGDDDGDFESVDVDVVSENALKVLVQAMENTNTKFFAGDEDESAYAAITDALEKGALEITFDAGELSDLINSIVDVELADTGATIYFDKANGKYAVTAGTKVNGEKIDGTIFIDKDGIKLMSESILGTTDTYAINLDSIINKLENSAFAQLMGGMPAGMLDPYKGYMNAFKAEYEKLFANTEIAADNVINVLLSRLNPTVTETDGIIVLSYTLDNKTLEAFAKAAIDEAAKIANLEDDLKAMLLSYVEQYVPMINSMATIDLKAEFHLNAEDTTFAKQVIKGSVTVDGMAVSVDMTTTFTENEIKMAETMDMAGQKITSSIACTRTENNGAVTYKVVANGSMNQGGTAVEMKVCEIEATYKNGDVSVKVTVPVDETFVNTQTIELIGKLDLSNGAKFTFTSVKMGNEVLVEGVALTFNFIPGKTAPATGTVKDVLDLSADDLLAFEEMIENGALKIFMRPSAEPDYSVSGSEIK